MRVVPKAARAARRIENAALPDPFGAAAAPDPGAVARRPARSDSAPAAAPAAGPRSAAQQLGVIRGVVGARACIASRDGFRARRRARPPRARSHRRAPRAPVAAPRGAPSTRRSRRKVDAGLLRRATPERRTGSTSSNGRPASSAANSRSLPALPVRDDQPAQAARALCCASCNRAMPCEARSSKRSSSWRRKACPSAVPCTSTKPPPLSSSRRSCRFRRSNPRHSRDPGQRRRGRCPPRRPRPGRAADWCSVRAASSSVSTASASATKPPVIAAVRVPPSACSTSQSSVTVRSPSAFKIDHGAQRATDQPLDLLRAARSACRARPRARERVWVARGSMPYSAVTQPCPSRAGTRARRPRRSPCRAPASRRMPPAPSLRRAPCSRARSDSGAQLIGRAAARSHAHAARQRSAAALVLSL